MLIAQTGSNALFPVAEPEGSTSVSNLWWMLPLAAAIFAFAWYLRPRKAVSQPAEKSSKGHGRKSSVRTRDAVSEPQLLESLPGDQQPTSTTRTIGSKKKKSSKKKNASTNKTTQSLPVVAAVTEVAVADVGKATVSTPTNASQSVSTVAKEVPDPKPVNAIFEPLRDAVKERRKSQYVEESGVADSNSTSKQREPDLVQQLFGGKFERIVPRASIRSHADRWPAPAAQQVKNTDTIASRPQPMEAAKPEPVTVPAALAPAKGLKSFVSKVVKSDSSID